MTMNRSIQVTMASPNYFATIFVMLYLSSWSVRASTVRYYRCMTDKTLPERLKELELKTDRGEEEEKEYQRMVEKRGFLKYLVGDYSGMTVQARQRCHCGSTTRGLVKVNPSFCYERCSGNCRQRCGGHVALSVYETGYEREPYLHQVDVGLSQRGCREESDGLTICDRRTAHLFSPRMSALLCVNYCHSKGNHVAAFKDDSTCCCGRRFPDNWRDRGKYEPDHWYCNKPCAVKKSRPMCVGRHEGKPLSAIFDASDGRMWPKGYRPPPFDLSKGWLIPVFPATDKFEREEYKPNYIPPEERRTIMTTQTTPSTNVTNTTTIVFEEEKQNITWETIGIAAGCVVLLIWIVVATIFHRRNQSSPDVFKLPDHLKPNQQRQKNPPQRMVQRRGGKKKGPPPGGTKAQRFRGQTRPAKKAKGWEKQNKSGPKGSKYSGRNKNRNQNFNTTDEYRSQNQGNLSTESDWTDSDSPHTALLWEVL